MYTAAFRVASQCHIVADLFAVGFGGGFRDRVRYPQLRPPPSGDEMWNRTLFTKHGDMQMKIGGTSYLRCCIQVAS